MKKKSFLLLDEEVLIKGNQSSFIHVKNAFFFVLIILYYLYGIRICSIREREVLLFLVPLFILWIIFFSLGIVKDKTNNIYLTNQRLIIQTFFKIVEETIDETQVIHIEQSFLGKIWHYGTLQIEGRTINRLNYIKSPYKIKKMFLEMRKKDESVHV